MARRADVTTSAAISAVSHTVRSRSVRAHDRLDAAFFADQSVAATEQVALLEVRGTPITHLGELGRVWDPARFARAWAAPLEQGLPYLRPYDVFDYLPTAAQRLSLDRNDSIDDLRLTPGTILQTCSGRNLGPCTYVDADLATFALSHDMIRVDIDDDDLRLYVLAYLQTPTGQALLRRGRSGSVIDHLTVGDVSAVPVPLVADDDTEPVRTLMRQSVDLREHARCQLRAALALLAEQYPPSAEDTAWTSWTTNASTLDGRLDAAHHAPSVRAAKGQLTDADGVQLSDLAAATLPARYKRYYVSGDNGRPIVSGRQLLQPEPINLRRVSDRSFRDPDSYLIRAGMVIFGADGRAEGRQGSPALVTPDRDCWLASNHVMRLIPHQGVRPGALWLGVASKQGQVQIKALSFGSVVDQVNPEDVENVLLPPVDDESARNVESAWADHARATALAREAASRLQRHLDDTVVGTRPPLTIDVRWH